MLPKKEETYLRHLDKTLIMQFEKRYSRSKQASKWQNLKLKALLAGMKPGVAGLQTLRNKLEDTGLFDIRIEKHRWRDSDGKSYVHTLARAATTGMWPMGTHYWVRDNAVIGVRYLRSKSRVRRKIGREILLSSLTFMSSCAQLSRMEGVIRATSQSFIADAQNWPYIFAGIKDNLHCQNTEIWAHKQDAWQILVWHVLNAIDDGIISLRDLSVKMRRFIGLIVPFLLKVSCWKAENSGSWEEIPAIRSSVRAWEHRLVVRLGELSLRRDFAFLQREYARVKRYVGAQRGRENFASGVAVLDRELTKALVRDLPLESPMYGRKDPRYRAADAALIYLLELDYPQFLAARAGRSSAWAQSLEKKLVAQVLTLHDDRSGGVYRYSDDTYQRSGFFRNLTTARLKDMYGAPSGNASSNFAGRNFVVPRGRKAAWTHFVWQLAAWAGRRFIETDHVQYLKLHEKFFMQGLKLVTGPSKTLEQGADGRVRIINLPAWQMPECYIADKTQSGREMVFPSPHTPLNWATAEMLAAFEVREAVLGIMP